MARKRRRLVGCQTPDLSCLNRWLQENAQWREPFLLCRKRARQAALCMRDTLQDQPKKTVLLYGLASGPEENAIMERQRLPNALRFCRKSLLAYICISCVPT